MTKASIPPFRTAGPESVTEREWLLLGESDEAPLPSELPDWDPATPIRVARQLSVDGPSLRRQCGLGDDDVVHAVVLWRTPGTGLRGSGRRTAISLEAAADVVLEAKLPGEQLATSVELRSSLILAHRSSKVGPYDAHLPGSVLWTDVEPRKVMVEGSSSRFPIAIVRFGGAQHLPLKAGWSVDIDFDALDQPPLSNILLLINEENAAAVSAVSGGTSERDEMIRRVIKLDIARRLVIGALLNEIPLEDDSWPEGSLGVMIRRLIRSLFPGDGIDRLRVEARTGSPRLETKLQASLSFMDF